MAVTLATPEELRSWQHTHAESVATLSAADVLTAFRTNPQGLSTEEAHARLQVAGIGDSRPRHRGQRLLQLLAILIRPLLLPLWIAAIIAFGIDRDRTGQALVIAAGLNTLVAALQERKAERSTAALYDSLPSYTRVLRNGHEENILASMLVPGDILLLRPNDIISADARLIQADHLHISSPVLAGDNDIVHKTSVAVFKEEVSGPGLPNIVYASSRVMSGHGRAVVFATGFRTAFGRIATLTQQAHEEPSPLLIAVARLGIIVLAVAVLGAVSSYLYTISLGLSVEEGLLLAVLFLTAAVPVGLMPGITLTLIEGTRRLRQRNAVFRRLSSVETLGATTVICADKTGTLTQNEMTARELWTADGALDISGVGYQPRGAFSLDQRPLDSAGTQKYAGQLLQAAILTSRARLLPPDTFQPRWHILGDPVEAALITAAAKTELKAADVQERWPQLAVLNSTRRIALDGVIVQDGGQTLAYVKGAPSEVLNYCTAIATISGERALTERDRQAVKRALQRYQRDAMRVIAFARRTLNRGTAQDADIDSVAQGLVFLGLIAVNDPPREEVTSAITACHNAKIRTIMLTSDDTIGATSLARRCALIHGTKSPVLSGPELDTMDQAALKERLRDGDMVLARLTPEHKVRVVQALEALGEVVLVTGGAATDVPALKAAYTGIAMGATGTQAACEVADVILRDDNFATIAAAIAEGRAVEQRVRRLVALNLATTVVKLVALVAALATGLPLLLTVGQQLLIDFLAGLLPGLAIGAGYPDPRLMQRPPRATGRPLLSKKVYGLAYGWFGALAALLALAVTIAYMAQMRADMPPQALADLFATNLESYDVRITDPGGLRSLTATSLYVVVSIAALLGAALIRRSAAPNDRRPQLLLFGLVGLSFAMLVAIILAEPLHPYIALTTIPWWGWPVALGATGVVASLELLRQRFDPIFKPEPAPEVQRQLPKIQSANKP